jgi:hypothetical protein
MSATADGVTVTIEDRGPSLRTRIAAVAVVLALAGLAAYAMFSGPTIAPVPGGTGTTKSAPTKVAPPTEEQAPEGREGSNGG